MSILAPLWLAVAAVAAAGVIVAHLFSTNTPPKQVLPTVRFVPPGAPVAVLRTRRVTDLLLLVLRMLAVALLGLALAGAHVPTRGPARVVLVDVSRAVGTAHEDDADDADRVIVFDSVPRTIRASALDSVKVTGAKGSLSAALVAAHRSIAEVTTGMEDVELVIVSPLVREEVDSATAKLVALWQGPVRLVRTAAAPNPTAFGLEVRAEGDDPVRAAASLLPQVPGSIGARIVRTAATPEDSAWAGEGKVLVHWPMSVSSGSSVSSAGAVSTGNHTVIGLERPARSPMPGRTIARWANGEPAATEAQAGAGCVRDVAIGVDPVGDMALRESFRGLVGALVEPCGGARDFAPVPDSAILRRATAAAPSLAAAPDSRLPLILAVSALVLLAIEQLLRRRRRVA